MKARKKMRCETNPMKNVKTFGKKSEQVNAALKTTMLTVTVDGSSKMPIRR